MHNTKLALPLIRTFANKIALFLPILWALHTWASRKFSACALDDSVFYSASAQQHVVFTLNHTCHRRFALAFFCLLNRNPLRCEAPPAIEVINNFSRCAAHPGTYACARARVFSSFSRRTSGEWEPESRLCTLWNKHRFAINTHWEKESGCCKIFTLFLKSKFSRCDEWKNGKGAAGQGTKGETRKWLCVNRKNVFKDSLRDQEFFLYSPLA